MANNNSLNNTSYGFTLPSLNLNFTSTAQRITGDMSNATHANRLSFQTNVVNGATSPFIIPNGSGTIGQIVVANASNPTDSAFGSLQVDAASVKLVSNVLGLGVQLPIEIRIGLIPAININTSRAISIANTVAGNVPLTITGTTSGGITINQTPVATALTLNGTNTAGTYAQQNIAVTPGGKFDAFRAFNNSTTVGSGCQIEVAVDSQVAATGGDPTLLFTNSGGTAIRIGNDTSVNQYSMSTGTLGDANTFFTYDVATTQINLPKQCSFMAEVSVAIPNVTGNGAFYNVIFNSERFDVSNSYNNATGVFTAPKTGKYLFSGSLRISGLTALMTYAQVVLVNSGGNLLFGINNIGLIRSVTTAADNCCIPFSAIVSMTAGDATFIQIIIFNGAGNTAGIAISTSFWSGQLLS